MSDPSIGSLPQLEARVQRALDRCLEWSQQGRYRKVLSEVDRVLDTLSGHPGLAAQLLVWKAQALLSMGYPERALHAANRSWELATSPHSCSLIATALNATGEIDHADRFLRMGIGLFPAAIHLPVQLATMLTDQGRLPEALDVLEGVTPSTQLPVDMQVFLVGLRANLLATIGRWSEADAVLQEGLHRHPDSSLLLETHDSISREWIRNRAEESLAESWLASLEPVVGVSAEVDDAVMHFGIVLGLSDLVVLGARRLWRSFDASNSINIQAPDPWGVALLTAVLELDGHPQSVAAMARATASNQSTVRSAIGRIRRFLDRLDPGFSRRAFGAISNPRLDGDTREGAERTGSVLTFPISP